MKPVETQWLSYREAVIAPNAPSIQLQEMRRAFYAGAKGLLTEVLARLSEGQEVTEADLAFMESIQNELDAFAKAVLGGTA